MANPHPPAGALPRIRAIFAGRRIKPDIPGQKRRAYLFQTPSDRMREKAADFAKVLIGLVPDEQWHEDVIVTLKELIERGERRLEVALKTREDCRDYDFGVYPPPRDPAEPDDEPEPDEASEPYLGDPDE